MTFLCNICTLMNSYLNENGVLVMTSVPDRLNIGSSRGRKFKHRDAFGVGPIRTYSRRGFTCKRVTSFDGVDVPKGMALRVMTGSDITRLQHRGQVVKVVAKIDNLNLQDFSKPENPVSVRHYRLGRNRFLTHRKQRKKSSTTQLKEHFLVLVKLREQEEQEFKKISKLLEKMKDNDPPHYGIFADFVDETKLANTFFAMYQCFFVSKDKYNLVGKYSDDLWFAAFLFVLVMYEHLVNDNFETKCKTPFREFINNLAFPLNKDPRTFNNYVRSLNKFWMVVKEKPGDVKFEDEAFLPFSVQAKTFRKIVECFHQMDYFKELQYYLHKRS